ncbi:MAG: hypothetical protein JNK19_16925 [Tabrizicola sp.]|nr:hypothetical protein [Tabrizicola sp.]
MTVFRPAALSLVLVTACAPFPAIDRLGPETGPVPQLLPIDSLLEQASGDSSDPGAGLQARADALRARAAALGSRSPAP